MVRNLTAFESRFSKDRLKYSKVPLCMCVYMRMRAYVDVCARAVVPA